MSIIVAVAAFIATLSRLQRPFDSVHPHSSATTAVAVVVTVEAD